MAEQKTPFWKNKTYVASGRSGGNGDFDKGAVIEVAAKEITRKGLPVYNEDGTLSATLKKVYGTLEGFEPGQEITISGMSEACKKALEKGANTNDDPTGYVFNGVRRDDNGRVTVQFGHTLTDTRMAVPGIIEQPTVFYKEGNQFRAFKAGTATAEDITKLSQALEVAGKGVVFTERGNDDKTKAKRREATRGSNVSFMTRMYLPGGAVEIAPDDDGSAFETLHAKTKESRISGYMIRAHIVGKDGSSVLDSDKVVVETPKFDREATTYTLSCGDELAELAEHAQSIGGKVVFEAVPYMQVNASPLTDGSYDSTAVKLARKILAQAQNPRAAGLMRREAYAPGVVFATATKNEAGRNIPGVVLDLPEFFTSATQPPVATTKGIATKFFPDASKVRLVSTASKDEMAEAQQSATAASAPAQSSAPTPSDEPEFDVEHQPQM